MAVRGHPWSGRHNQRFVYPETISPGKVPLDWHGVGEGTLGSHQSRSGSDNSTYTDRLRDKPMRQSPATRKARSPERPAQLELSPHAPAHVPAARRGPGRTKPAPRALAQRVAPPEGPPTARGAGRKRSPGCGAERPALGGCPCWAEARRRPGRAGDMQRDSGQAAVPTEFLFPPPNGTGSLLPGSSVIQTYCWNLASLPTQHIRLTDPGDPKEQDSEEPKRRKGGWPKGKKRKPPRDLAVPRAPTTGYVIFLNEQKSQLRAQHPTLPFPEITKMLAAQWAQLPQEKKQRYVCEADEDQQRYIRELQAYQNSEAYRVFLQRRAAHEVQALCGTGAPGHEFEGKGPDFSAVDGDENDDLYCRTCKQFFSSLHNKRGHLLGKQHLQNLTGVFEKDSAECLKHLKLLEGEEGQNLNKGDSEEEAEYPDPLLGGLIPEKGFASFDLCFLQEFIFKLLQIKESELRELRKTLERAQAEQETLQRQLLEFQNRQQWLQVELASLKTSGVVLEKEFENLNTIIMLSHFGLRVMDTDGTAPQSPANSCRSGRHLGFHHHGGAVTPGHITSA
ncbi:uncharacterized protein LOC129561620 [Moschus berezovskii]|uniref:uncharacterized protein LOC129561620 n=1 Tax=Moschus berezovskii TaxID=68408 RepID=UPI002444A4A3|nr:uncharacterized protein LOC129561620 [Moschus berezovskii]